jgi:zinc transport system ATP-binding protein
MNREHKGMKKRAEHDYRTRGKKLLEMKSVSASYNGNPVFKNINLEIYEKDFLGLIGPNGSGKTTLLKVLLGLLPPLSGKINYYFPEKPGKTGNIGYLPQVSMFDKQFPINVEDVVLSGLMPVKGIFKRFSAKDLKKAGEMMELMGIIDFKNKAIGELSGGQMQRAFLARALVSWPRLLILDEPVTFVDKHFEKSLYEILRELNRQIAIIMVSHDLGMISSYVKSIACLSDTLFYHDSNEITQELLDKYRCPIDLITHGDIPHRVLRSHSPAND